ncbi:hypothetical protein BH20ACI3_BH20ACI3_02080 [soil metagenome]
MTDDEVLLAELVYSDAEILDRYRELCAKAAENPGQPVDEMMEVAGDVGRVLDRNAKD